MLATIFVLSTLETCSDVKDLYQKSNCCGVGTADNSLDMTYQACSRETIRLPGYSNDTEGWTLSETQTWKQVGGDLDNKNWQPSTGPKHAGLMAGIEPFRIGKLSANVTSTGNTEARFRSVVDENYNYVMYVNPDCLTCAYYGAVGQGDNVIIVKYDRYTQEVVSEKKITNPQSVYKYDNTSNTTTQHTISEDTPRFQSRSALALTNDSVIVLHSAANIIMKLNKADLEVVWSLALPNFELYLPAEGGVDTANYWLMQALPFTKDGGNYIAVTTSANIMYDTHEPNNITNKAEARIRPGVYVGSGGVFGIRDLGDRPEYLYYTSALPDNYVPGDFVKDESFSKKKHHHDEEGKNHGEAEGSRRLLSGNEDELEDYMYILTMFTENTTIRKGDSDTGESQNNFTQAVFLYDKRPELYKLLDKLPVKTEAWGAYAVVEIDMQDKLGPLQEQYTGIMYDIYNFSVLNSNYTVNKAELIGQPMLEKLFRNKHRTHNVPLTEHQCHALNFYGATNYGQVALDEKSGVIYAVSGNLYDFPLNDAWKLLDANAELVTASESHAKHPLVREKPFNEDLFKVYHKLMQEAADRLTVASAHKAHADEEESGEHEAHVVEAHSDEEESEEHDDHAGRRLHGASGKFNDKGQWPPPLATVFNATQAYKKVKEAREYLHNSTDARKHALKYASERLKRAFSSGVYAVNAINGEMLWGYSFQPGDKRDGLVDYGWPEQMRAPNHYYYEAGLNSDTVFTTIYRSHDKSYVLAGNKQWAGIFDITGDHDLTHEDEEGPSRRLDDKVEDEEVDGHKHNISELWRDPMKLIQFPFDRLGFWSSFALINDVDKSDNSTITRLVFKTPFTNTIAKNSNSSEPTPHVTQKQPLDLGSPLCYTGDCCYIYAYDLTRNETIGDPMWIRATGDPGTQNTGALTGYGPNVFTANKDTGVEIIDHQTGRLIRTIFTTTEQYVGFPIVNNVVYMMGGATSGFQFEDPVTIADLRNSPKTFTVYTPAGSRLHSFPK